MPGRVSNELPAYLHVLINHKMSPRGSIKLSISLSFLPLLPLTHGSPPHIPVSLRPHTFPFTSPLSVSKIVSIIFQAGAQMGTEKEK